MTNFHMGFISCVVGRSPNLLPPSLPTALFLLLLHMGLGAQLEMRINKEVVLNLCFVMISLYRKRESRSLLGYLCTTCSGSGLYVDSVLESQGIIVKVRCPGCGGSGNIMCSECGGRGHLG